MYPQVDDVIISWRNVAHYSGHACQACVGGFTAQEFHFADFTLDQSSYRLQRVRASCGKKSALWSDSS
jgi:hypothetical protein